MEAHAQDRNGSAVAVISGVDHELVICSKRHVRQRGAVENLEHVLRVITR
jgi:hypothetical protein